MPTFVQTARKWFKSDNIWLKDWKKGSQDPTFDMVNHLKKIIKYYPKNLKALKFLTPEIEGNPLEPSPEVLRLKKVIYAKYNKNFIRHIDVPEDHQNIEKLERVKPVSLSSLRISEHEFTNIPKTRIRTVKHVDSFEIRINNYGNPAESLIKTIRTIRPITSLTLHNLLPLPLKEYKCLFRHLKSRLESLTITGTYFCPAIENPGEFSELLEFFFNFPHLKVIHIDASDPSFTSPGIGAIPLDLLKQRKIKFDIRINHSNSETASLISPKNSQALSDIQVLGINNQQSFTQSEAVWDCIEEAHLEIQKNAEGNLFYVNRINLTSESLLALTTTCKKISTLNMNLIPPFPGAAQDFAALTELSNLQNLFIHFGEVQSPLLNLFESLGTLTQTHKKLEFASFEFLGGRVGKEYAVVEPFFEASKDVIKKVILKFRNLKEDISGVEYFYKGLQKLNQITTLSLLIGNIFENNFAPYHSDELPKLFENLNNLTELNLSLPQICQENNLLPNLHLSKSISKLSLALPDGKTCESFINNLPVLSDLQQLDLNLSSMSETTWKKLYQIISGLDLLETLRLKFDHSSFTIPIEDFKLLMETKEKFKFIVFQKMLFGCFVFTRRNYYEGDVDGFLALGSHGMPQKVSPTKTYFYSHELYESYEDKCL